MRPGSKSSRHSCPPPDGSSGTQLRERYGKAECGGWRPWWGDGGQGRDGAVVMVDTGEGEGTGVAEGARGLRGQDAEARRGDSPL